MMKAENGKLLRQRRRDAVRPVDGQGGTKNAVQDLQTQAISVIKNLFALPGRVQQEQSFPNSLQSASVRSTLCKQGHAKHALWCQVRLHQSVERDTKQAHSK